MVIGEGDRDEKRIGEEIEELKMGNAGEIKVCFTIFMF